MPQIHLIYDPNNRIVAPKPDFLRQTKCVAAVFPLDLNDKNNLDKIVRLFLEQIEASDAPPSETEKP